MGGTRQEERGAQAAGRPQIGWTRLSRQPIPKAVSICFAFHLHSTASGQIGAKARRKTRVGGGGPLAESGTQVWPSSEPDWHLWLGKALHLANGIPSDTPAFKGPLPNPLRPNWEEIPKEEEGTETEGGPPNSGGNCWISAKGSVINTSRSLVEPMLSVRHGIPCVPWLSHLHFLIPD